MKLLMKLLTVLVAVVALAACGDLEEYESSSDTTSTWEDVVRDGEAEEDGDFAFPIEWPKTNHGIAGGEGEGCFEVTVPSGDDAYYLKLKSGDKTVWDAFMHPGTKFKFAVPLGTFDLSYGVGQSWYGWDDTFGSDGSYAVASDQFKFDGRSCWTVELQRRVGGNLGASSLDQNEF